LEKNKARIFAKEKINQIQNRFEKENSMRESILNLLANSKKIISYRADQFEVNLDFLEDFTHLEIYYPKVTSIQNKTLSFIEPITWEIGAYSIPEPLGEKILKPIDADFILIPALGYNFQGFRLGRGAGFYDRALENIKREKIIGFSFRELFSIDFTPSIFDLRVSKLILEKEILNFEE
jgi:5-formyltetrahydrofolate cyclo-ligase